ncbi:hypothetical protein P171DRAFT_480097 [Karstenula rhodostoma CBS 690.94]|uniref:Gfd2/YDR514C-like C-terminal domain-containing protein n=1 Tax=Karstenula rhodostoma CBS 690.94 TaxID=1392251 RepID=A0A9P4UHV9_9PLEO|nr:hypothetical protein P171DRAFT_480097 [Karstenula rhodostoma CBS 690.94]
MSSTTANLAKQLENFYDGHSELAVFQDIIGTARLPNSPQETDSIIVITVDTETHGERHPPVLQQLYSEPVKPGLLLHQRLLPNTHLVNNAPFHKGDPEKNRFGGTRFTTHKEAELFMDQWFTCWPLNPAQPDQGNCPIVIMGHDVSGDVSGLMDSLHWDPSITGSLLRILDTWAMARSVRIPSRGYQIGLGTLVSHYNFAYRGVHTASNDAA